MSHEWVYVAVAVILLDSWLVRRKIKKIEKILSEKGWV